MVYHDLKVNTVAAQNSTDTEVESSLDLLIGSRELDLNLVFY